MKNYILLLLLSLITVNSFAQEFHGKAYYMSKTKMNPNFGKNMPPERKQRMNNEKGKETHAIKMNNEH